MHLGLRANSLQLFSISLGAIRTQTKRKSISLLLVQFPAIKHMNNATAALLTLASLSFLSGLCFLILFLLIRPLREGPGQLILGQCLAQVVLDLHWFSINEVWRHEKGNSACETVGFFSYCGFVMACVYSAAICIAVSKHFEYMYFPSNRFYHVVAISLSISLALVLAGTQGVGSSTLGTQGSWAE